MVIGEMFLSAFLQALFQSLMSPIVNDFIGGQEKKENILERLKTTILTLSAVLIDAEEKQITKEPVQYWVNDLKDAIYKAEDVLDDIITEASLRKETTNWKKMLDRMPSLLSGDTNTVVLKSKLREVTQRLEYLASQRTSLSLTEVRTTRHIARLKTTSEIGEPRVIGRQTDKEQIMRFLMADSTDNIKISVVAIVGIGGVGKTTLAQLLYNESHFQEKAWIHVSEEVDIFSLTKTIYESVTKCPCAFTDLNLLHVYLKRRIGGKKILVVLDDMWSETFENWNLLCQPFASAAKGSRIIVTTRSHRVATNVRANYVHILQPLSFEECWVLFMEQVIGAQERNLNREIGMLAEQVVDKCQGLPLAAKALGGLLWSSREVDYWRKIINSKIWTLPSDSTILPVLRVSYHYLPLHLKRCFAYCSIFPKGYAFNKERVVLLWRAEGLLQQADITKRMEHVGDEYFSELVSRSLFQQNRDAKFTMHDLINELAQFAAGEFCFKYENQIQEISGKTRHLSYLRDQYSGEATKFEVLYGVKFLRTFLPMSLIDSTQTFCLNKMVSHKLLPNLTCLRVLSLSHYSIAMLPSDIFKRMRHVRYLDLSRTNLERLPTSVRFLYNLQTLLLSHCAYLIQLEEAICNLVSLEYLDLTAATRLKHMPKKFGRLKRLQTLTTFVVGIGKGTTISELRDLKELRGKLTILELHRVGDISDAEEAYLESKTHLKEIDFIWRTRDPIMDYITGTHNEDAIFEKLRPHNRIEELTIKKYYGDSFPVWMSDPSFSSIVCLSLTECQRCTSLPSLGRLAGLKELHISKMRQLRSIGLEFYTSHPESRDQEQQPFRSLQMLSFEDMPNWEEWVNIEVYGKTLFPNLQKLFIVRCPQLTSDLPGRFPSLISLQIRQSENLVFQPDHHKYTQLQRLILHRSCDSLTELTLDYFSTLEELEISECMLQSFQLSDELLSGFILRRLRISDCPDLMLLPQGLYQPQNKEHTISNCRNLGV